MHNPMSGKARADFESWILDPENQELKTEVLKDQWIRMEQLCLDMPLSSSEKKERLDAIHARIGIKSSRKRNGLYMPWWAVASCVAAFALLLGVVAVLPSRISEKVRTCLVASSSDKGEFVLPDGTKVWLNSNGKIEYEGDFCKGRVRAVRLEGEAFFDVIKSETPFVVDLGDVQVEVLGTRFNARNSSHYKDYQVTLVDGKVKVCGESFSEVVLKPGQQFCCTSERRAPIVRNVKTSNYSSWTEDTVIFDNMTLCEIATNLEHWYNVKIVFEDGVNKKERLSFKLGSETLRETLSLIEKVAGLECDVVDGRTVYLMNINPKILTK